TSGRLQKPFEVESRQCLYAGSVGQVEMDRRQREKALVDGSQVRAVLVHVAGLEAVDAVALAAAGLLFLKLQRVVVAPLAQARDARAVQVSGRTVDVDERL